MKKLFWILIFSSLFANPVFAGNDILVTCNTGADCIKSSDLPLFHETNTFPGFTQTQTFSVRNNRNSTCNITLRPSSSSPDLLTSQINLNINGFDYYLSELLNPDHPSLSLGHVNKNTRENYPFAISLVSSAGNQFQNQTSTFDLNFNFQCDGDSLSPTSVPINQPPSDPGCDKSSPLAPTQFYGTRNTNGSITLHWTQTTSEHTGYLIAYGTNPGVYLYGAPDIGNNDHYTVQNLTHGAQYCFYVRSLNSCMPGERTPEYCVNPQSTILASTTPAPGFLPDVLGDQTTEPVNVLGTQTVSKTCAGSYLPFVFFIALAINLLFVSVSPNIIQRVLFPIFISLSSYFLDYYFLTGRCCLLSDIYCHYFWIGSLGSYIVPLLTTSLKKH